MNVLVLIRGPEEEDMRRGDLLRLLDAVLGLLIFVVKKVKLRGMSEMDDPRHWRRAYLLLLHPTSAGHIILTIRLIYWLTLTGGYAEGPR